MKWLFVFVHFFSEKILVNCQVWPEGRYGVPKPWSGCPHNWQIGYLKQDLENDDPKSQFSTDLHLHMDAKLTGGDIERRFCVKTSTQSVNTRWPDGTYCVYRKGNQCPTGMKHGSITWDDEDDSNKNKVSGTLPDGTYGTQETTIHYCCQDKGSWSDSIELPIHQPFYLLPHKSKDCQRVKGARSTLDWITYDTENNQNRDAFVPSHGFTDGKKDLPKIYYCYYEGCQHKLQNESGTISTSRFPDYQYCSWSITVNQSFVVSLDFISINIPTCSNYMYIYDGSDETAPLLVTLCDANATSGISLRSTGNNMFITLRSGNNKNNNWNIQYQAEYKTTTPSHGLSWPSGTYGLPKTLMTCPDKWIPGWKKQIMEDDINQPKTVLSTTLRNHMDVSLLGYALTRHFCFKTVDDETSQTWPKGKYCIYKKNQCPAGMDIGSIILDDEDDPKTGANAQGGIIPDGDNQDNQNAHQTKIFYCCNDEGEWSESIELPTHEPFYLLPHKSKNCQRVKRALSTLEYITYDTEEQNNYDEFKGSHPYIEGGKRLPTIFYCYYQGCGYKLTNDVGSFSTLNYPDHQYCSWSITVKQYMQILLEFTTMNIPDCAKNQLEIYDGVDSTAGILGKFCGDNATSGNTIRSTKNNLYLILKSGNNDGKTLQLEATYKSEQPITERSWPSGTYGLPKTNENCPAGWVQGARVQYMDRKERFLGSTSSLFHMDAAINPTEKYIKRKFCMKTINSGQNQPFWPNGSYCTYKKHECLAGMSDGYILWDDLDGPGNGNTKSGILPDGDYDGTDRDTKIYYCCRDHGHWYNPIDLPISEPFFLLPYGSKNCQRVKWAISTLESITYDTENSHNRDEFSASHAFTDKQKESPTIYYCYYEGCRYEINAESPSFISVSKTTSQDFLKCSWLLSVSRGNISLIFTSLSVPNCGSGNFVEVYDGSDEQSTPLARYCGTITTSSIVSTRNHLLVLVKSGNNAQMGTTVNFNATFKNNRAFSTTAAPPITTKSPGKSIPKTTSQTTLKPTPKSTPKATSMATQTLKPTTKTTAKTTPKPTTKTTAKTIPKPTTKTTPKTTPKPTTKTTAKTTPKPTTKTTPKPTTKTTTKTTPKPTPKTTLKPKPKTTTKPTRTPTFKTTRQTTRQTSPAMTPNIQIPTTPKLPSEEIPQPPTRSNTKEPQKTTKPNESGPDASKSEDSSTNSLAIVIPICVTVLTALLMVMIFYQRRIRKDNSNSGTADQRNPMASLPNLPFKKARYSKPSDKVELQKERLQADVGESSNNPLYGVDPFEDNTYCTIDDAKDEYDKEVALRANQGASTSSLDHVYAKCSENTVAYETLPETSKFPRIILPSESAYETPTDSTPTTSYNTPSLHYKMPTNQKSVPVSYENIPQGNNNPHYQVPNAKHNTDIYEKMDKTIKGQPSLPENTGMTQC